MSTHIIGILDCKNKTIFGINKNSNVPLVIFKPFDNSLPKYLLPSKLKYTNKNYYAVIKFSENNSKYRFPIGSLVYTIGKVGDEKAYYEFLLHTLNLNIKEPKISNTKMKKYRKTTNIWEIISNNDVKDYKDYRKEYTISIDPVGSLDIDDAITYHNNKIGIHIADASFWLDKFNINPHFFSTIYAPHRKINMIPSLISDNLASLIEKKDRLALTLWYNFETDSYYYEKTIINVNKNFSYLDYPTSSPIYEFSKIIGQKYNMDINNWDKHKMIEAFMILANNKTAEYLLKYKKQQIFRNHNKKEHDIKIWNIKNEKFKKFMNIYLSNSAEYSTTQGKHFGLNLDLYTHFTSPIRRMADIYVHRIIKGQNVSLDLEKCNSDMKLTKRLKRQFDRYNVIKNLKHTIQIDGYVVNYNEGKITVYFPKLDFCDKFHILPFHLINNNNLFLKQVSKIKQLGKLNITIAKKENKLIYNF